MLLAGCPASVAQPATADLAQRATAYLAQPTTAQTAQPATTLDGADTLARSAVDSMSQTASLESEPPAGMLWDAANTAYINGDFDWAAGAYEQLLSTGVASAKLYYNLANAYFKQDALGKAILFYHRALRLEPGNGDIRYNLSVAEARTKDNIEAIPEFFFVTWMRDIRHLMGCTSWSVLSLMLLVCALALSMLYLLSRRLSLRKAGFYGTIVAALLFVVALWFAWGARRELLDRSSAVVMSLSTAVKSSPDRTATDIFVLHEGALLSIENRLDDWCEVVIADGKKGWIEARKIEVI